MHSFDAAAFLKKRFREYYKRNFVDSVNEVEKREFGVGDFGKKITSRHLGFSSANEFNSFLRENTPLFVSSSVALYEFPSSRPMESKNRLKSGIVYEFDADDLRTECKKDHDSWKCRCGEKGKGLLDNCPACGERVEREEWVCPECLNATKKQLLELIEFIQNDFGFSSGISVNFSGSKGFHLHLNNKEVLHLSASARIELLDYLTANELDLKQIGFVKEEKKLLCPSPLTSVGWPKRISSRLIELFKEGNAQKISAFSGSSFRETEKILKEKKGIISMIERGVLLQSMPRAEKFWNSLNESLLEEMRLRIDRQTSVDMAKLIRVPDTIHGGTGLLAKTVSLEELKGFEPLNEAIIFSTNPCKILVERTPKFCLNGQEFGPFENEETELPEYAAVYLIARGAANGTVL